MPAMAPADRELEEPDDAATNVDPVEDEEDRDTGDTEEAEADSDDSLPMTAVEVAVVEEEERPMIEAVVEVVDGEGLETPEVTLVIVMIEGVAVEDGVGDGVDDAEDI